jgi:hypothetical protein
LVYQRFVLCYLHSRWTGGRSSSRIRRCRRLDTQIAIQFGLGNPLVAETGQRPQVAALDQVEDGFIVHAQQNRDRPGGMNFYNVTHAFGRGGGVTTRTRHHRAVAVAFLTRLVGGNHKPLLRWTAFNSHMHLSGQIIVDRLYK